jgi:hypothetical protein
MAQFGHKLTTSKLLRSASILRIAAKNYYRNLK